MNNPQQLLNMIINNSQAMQNPVFANAMQMYRQGNTKGLQEVAQNLCKSKGIPLEEVQKRLGI